MATAHRGDQKSQGRHRRKARYVTPQTRRRRSGAGQAGEPYVTLADLLRSGSDLAEDARSATTTARLDNGTGSTPAAERVCSCALDRPESRSHRQCATSGVDAAPYRDSLTHIWSWRALASCQCTHMGANSASSLSR